MALSAPWVGASPMTIIAGLILILAGINFVILALEAQAVGKGRAPFLLGLSTGVTGVCLLIWPSMTGVTTTALLSTYLITAGVLTVAFGLDFRPVRGWSWFVFAGAGSVGMAASTWFQFPLSGEMAVGSSIGISLLGMGGSLIALQPPRGLAEAGLEQR